MLVPSGTVQTVKFLLSIVLRADVAVRIRRNLNGWTLSIKGACVVGLTDGGALTVLSIETGLPLHSLCPAPLHCMSVSIWRIADDICNVRQLTCFSA